MSESCASKRLACPHSDASVDIMLRSAQMAASTGSTAASRKWIERQVWAASDISKFLRAQNVAITALVSLGSLPPFAAFAQQKNLADTLSVRFLRAALSISHLQRTAALRPFRHTQNNWLQTYSWTAALLTDHASNTRRIISGRVGRSSSSRRASSMIFSMSFESRNVRASVSFLGGAIILPF